MRLMRLLVASIAAIALTMGLASAPAQAADRTAWSKVVKQRGKLIFKVDVNPGHARKYVTVQKRNCWAKRCKWKNIRKVRTDANGRARTRITAPRRGSWYWRWVVPGSGPYPKVYSKVWRTYRI